MTTTQLAKADKLAERIKNAYDEFLAAGQDMASKLVTIGTNLEAAKELFPHGEWGEWVERNLPFGVRQAQRYIQAAKNIAAKSDTACRISSLKSALKALPSTISENSEKIPRPKMVHQKELERLPEDLRETAWNTVLAEAPPTATGTPKVTTKAVRSVVADTLAAAEIPTLPKCIAKDIDVASLKPQVVKALQAAAIYNASINRIREVANDIEGYAGESHAIHLRAQDCITELRNAIASLKFAMPYAPCPYCGQAGCEACKPPGTNKKGTGWIPRGVYDQAMKEKG